ncbi:MAG: hypothetical protein ACR2RV_19990, partial [Verrucomicrobiales bacterium]
WWPPIDLAGLGQDRIVLLTSLAPGADTIAAQVALEEGIEVLAPLPFPPEIYRSSSSFCGERVAAGAQQVFDELVAGISGPVDTFPVLLHTDQELDAETRTDGYRADLGDSERCNLRYRASGEFVAAHSHLLLALYDAADDLASGLETGAGTGSIVHVRRSVPSIRFVPRPDELPWTECGPVLHLRTRSIKRTADPSKIDQDTSWQTTRARLLPPYPVVGGAPEPSATAPSPDEIGQVAAELYQIASSLDDGDAGTRA